MLQEQQVVGFRQIFNFGREDFLLNPEPIGVLNAPQPTGF
jgi:hypothetical protein